MRLPDRLASGPARWISVAALSALLVIVALVPSDSVAVEQGGALPLLPLAVVAFLTAFFSERERPRGADRLLDVLVWAVAAWIAIAAVSIAGVGNLRGAVNEAWWWVTAAAVFTAARRSLAANRANVASIVLLVALGCGLALHAAHQQWVTFPADRAFYEADPERALQESGVFAPPGSPHRALFEARLYGGGPTATFALANSLAAVLLMAIVLAAGILTTLERHQSRLRIGIAAGLAVALCGVALLWTESRSAVLGLAVAGGVALLAWTARRRAGAGGQRRWWQSGAQGPWLSPAGIAAASIALAGLVTALVWIPRRPDLFSGAPRSVRYRMEYWRATLRMLRDHPWFGAGPGNFQDRYLTYRLDEASESIADPHNWIMETLATGGVPAVLLLTGAIAVGLWIALGRPAGVARNAGGGLPAGGELAAAPRAAVSSGAGGGFAVVFLAWISQFYLPNFDALMLSLIGAVGMAIALRPLTQSASAQPSPTDRRPAAAAGQGAAAGQAPAIGAVSGAAAAGVAVHLLASGGWTVPGVAAPWLVIIAIALGRRGAAPEDHRDAAELSRGLGYGSRFAVAGLGAALLAAWMGTAWLPQRRAAEQMERGNGAVQAGRFAVAVEAYETAAVLDPWDPLPLVRQADVLRWEVVRGADSPAAKRRWQAAWEAAIGRNRGSALLWQGRAEQRMHFFQRWGKREDLSNARHDLLEALARSKSSVATAAQLAVVEAALGNPQAAQRWRRRADELAAAGNHSDRQLTVVQVLPAETIGPRAEMEPLRVAAAERLRRIEP